MTTGPGDAMGPAGYGHIRASTADRERAADVLKAAFAEGRLDQGEYTERLDGLYLARTYAELAALTYDLPAGPLGAMPAVAVPVGQPAPVAGRTTVRTSDSAVVSLVLGLGGLVVGIASVPAIIFGIIGVVATRHNRMRGRYLAVVGLVLGIMAPLLVRLH